MVASRGRLVCNDNSCSTARMADVLSPSLKGNNHPDYTKPNIISAKALSVLHETVHKTDGQGTANSSPSCTT